MTEITVEEAANLPRPDLRIKINEDTSVKMSYGLLMDLQRLLPNPAAALELVMVDAYTQDYVVRRVMTPTTGTIMQIEDLIPSEEIDLDPEKVEEILSWVVQHILHFFARRAVDLAKTGELFKTALPSLFTTGSPALASTTPSAGPSE